MLTSYPRSKRSKLKPRSKRDYIICVIKRVFLVTASLWVVSVLILRFVNPPITPLISIRAVEYLLNDKPMLRGWSWLPLNKIPLQVQQAVVAAEDARFMEHWGVDLSAVGAALEDSDARMKPRGASTITMQTVKNVFLWPGRSYIRKVIEGVMAPLAEVVWGKRRTLEIYLNVIEWGEGIYGIEAAAQHYFNCSAQQLTLEQSAALAAILPAPRRLSPKRLSSVSQRRFYRIVKEARAVPLPVSFTRVQR